MLGADVDEVGWPECGEIDIMEFRGQDPELVHGSLHGPGYSGAEPISGTFRLPDDQTFTDDFHIFAVEWDPGRITFSVDFEIYQATNSSDVSARGDWVYDHEFFVLLNLAVGGGFVGPVGPDTVFPAEVLVDYVRIFERAQ
jgi:beta-glucanase (GH16 family)